jgi:hypothetical protein
MIYLSYEDTLKGMEVGAALDLLKSNNVEFDYEPETEDCTGSIYLGGYWSDHVEFEIEDGKLDKGYHHYWD